MKTLIVVDMQNDFVTGALGSKEAQAIVPAVQKRIKLAQENGELVIFTRDTHYANYFETLEGKMLPVEHCIEGSEGWKVIPELEDEQAAHIDKVTFGYKSWIEYFEQNELEIDEIELCGVCTDICVVSNALALRMEYPDMPIRVCAGCCAGTSVEKHNAALEVMKSCQIVVEEEN